MAERKTNIVSSISKTTGSSESDTNRIITEFVRTLRDAASNKRTIVVPGKKLPTRLKEQLLKLETLYEKGIELLEDAGGFNDWLRSDEYRSS